MIILKNLSIGDPLEFLKIQFVAKYQKSEGGPLETLKKIREKSKNETSE